MKVALCEDHLTFSEALEGLLTGLGHEVVRRQRLRARGAVGSDADVLVVDLHFPASRGARPSTLCVRRRRLSRSSSSPARRDSELIEQAFVHGANGAVLKTEGIVGVRVGAEAGGRDGRP